MCQSLGQEQRNTSYQCRGGQLDRCKAMREHEKLAMGSAQRAACATVVFGNSPKHACVLPGAGFGRRRGKTAEPSQPAAATGSAAQLTVWQMQRPAMWSADWATCASMHANVLAPQWRAEGMKRSGGR